VSLERAWWAVPLASGGRGLLRGHDVRPPLLLLAVLGLGCGPPCVLEAPVTLPDAGVASCVQSADCPRPANVLLCASTEDRLRGCIACQATRCVRFTPGTCP
jgi:hypothetical protein